VESRGYLWIGADRNVLLTTAPLLAADFEALPVASGRSSAVVAWQVIEYLPKIESAVKEAWRVLETGGVFCGSVSFLEPVHGRSYGGLSPLGLRSLLEKVGFKDIQVLPGLCGFSLMAWTWLRRLLGPWAGRLALPFMAGILTPLMAARFLLSWLSSRIGWGTGHGMRWVAQQAPLEFAGQLVFIARKSAQRPE
jgi:ubiquinone/menaquinone biosynthesis C-methylase UbiE